MDSRSSMIPCSFNRAILRAKTQRIRRICSGYPNIFDTLALQCCSIFERLGGGWQRYIWSEFDIAIKNMARALKETLEQMMRQLASAIGAPEPMLPVIGMSNDFANPYIEIDGTALNYIVRERGEILHQRQTFDPQQLLYWVFEHVTFMLASEYEMHHRIKGQDARRLLFDHQVQLMQRLRPDWRSKLQMEINQILGWSPFRDATE